MLVLLCVCVTELVLQLVLHCLEQLRHFAWCSCFCVLKCAADVGLCLFFVTDSLGCNNVCVAWSNCPMLHNNPDLGALRGLRFGHVTFWTARS